MLLRLATLCLLFLQIASFASPVRGDLFERLSPVGDVSFSDLIKINGEIWLTSDDGLYRFHQGSFVHVWDTDKYISDLAFFEDKLWLATEQGLIAIDWSLTDVGAEAAANSLFNAEQAHLVECFGGKFSFTTPRPNPNPLINQERQVPSQDEECEKGTPEDVNLLMTLDDTLFFSDPRGFYQISKENGADFAVTKVLSETVFELSKGFDGGLWLSTASRVLRYSSEAKTKLADPALSFGAPSAAIDLKNVLQIFPLDEDSNTLFLQRIGNTAHAWILAQGNLVKIFGEYGTVKRIKKSRDHLVLFSELGVYQFFLGSGQRILTTIPIDKLISQEDLVKRGILSKSFGVEETIRDVEYFKGHLFLFTSFGQIFKAEAFRENSMFGGRRIHISGEWARVLHPYRESNLAPSPQLKFEIVEIIDAKTRISKESLWALTSTDVMRWNNESSLWGVPGAEVPKIIFSRSLQVKDNGYIQKNSRISDNKTVDTDHFLGDVSGICRAGIIENLLDAEELARFRSFESKPLLFPYNGAHEVSTIVTDKLGNVTCYGPSKVFSVDLSWTSFIITLLPFLPFAFLFYRWWQDSHEFDSLTGLRDRRRIGDAALAQEFALQYSDRKNVDTKQLEGVALMLLDIDHFGRYNKSYGHTAGDRALSCVGKALKMEIREKKESFIVKSWRLFWGRRSLTGAYRWGGEEFLIIIEGIGIERAMERADHIRKAIKNLHENNIESLLSESLTASIGFSVFPSNARSWDELMKLTDRCVRKAKREGRDTVVEPSHLDD